MSTDTPPPAAQPGYGSERRRSPRYQVALDATFQPVETLDAVPKGIRAKRTITIDLSLTGACLYSDSLYRVGSKISCAISISGRANPLQNIGTVVWFRKTGLEARGYKLGVEFGEFSAEDQAALKALFEHPPATAASREKKVLLVEDDQEFQLALKLRFESVGFQVMTANDGLEGLRKGREEHPNVIVLDLMLPNLNGYDICRLLKFDQKFRHIPIILLTARSRREDKEMGCAVGADAYVVKPFDGKGLLTKVDELLNSATRG